MKLDLHIRVSKSISEQNIYSLGCWMTQSEFLWVDEFEEVLSRGIEVMLVSIIAFVDLEQNMVMIMIMSTIRSIKCEKLNSKMIQQDYRLNLCEVNRVFYIHISSSSSPLPTSDYQLISQKTRYQSTGNLPPGPFLPLALPATAILLMHIWSCAITKAPGPFL